MIPRVEEIRKEHVKVCKSLPDLELYGDCDICDLLHHIDELVEEVCFTCSLEDRDESH